MIVQAAGQREAQLMKELDTLKARLWDTANRNTELERYSPAPPPPPSPPPPPPRGGGCFVVRPTDDGIDSVSSSPCRVSSLLHGSRCLRNPHHPNHLEFRSEARPLYVRQVQVMAECRMRCMFDRRE